MRTVVVILIGFALLALFTFGARLLSPGLFGPKAFIGVWLAFSVIDFCVGVFGAGYSATMEFAIHAVVFGLPAGAAWALHRRAAAGAGK